MKKRAKDAFTLLEVMAAVLIAGLMLTSLYASEAGSIKMKQRAINMSLGALLVRCKMGEIEEQIADEGLPAVFASESDGCCAEAEIDGFSCEWEISRIELPETMFMGEEENEEDIFSQQGTLPDTTMDDPTDLLSGPPAGEIDALAAQAMQFVYPVLKPSIEEQIRRVTIAVRWKEGSAQRSFSVNRYLVAEQPPPVPEEE
jgi:prepilin-type N-terminal cleavage/methylation domain-containing protein